MKRLRKYIDCWRGKAKKTRYKYRENGKITRS